MRFVIFRTPAGADTIINTAQIVTVDQVQDSTQEGQDEDVCRVFLTAPIWADEDEKDRGQRCIDVLGGLHDVHRVLNGID